MDPLYQRAGGRIAAPASRACPSSWRFAPAIVRWRAQFEPDCLLSAVRMKLRTAERALPVN